MVVGKVYKCKRCGHLWPSRVEHKPKQCPNCKSPLWDKDYIRHRKGDQNSENQS